MKNRKKAAMRALKKKQGKVLETVHASGEPRQYLSRYVGNSAQVEKAREAYAKADAWARGRTARYGGK